MDNPLEYREPGVDDLSRDQLRQRVAQVEKSRDQLAERLAVHSRVFFDNPVPALIYSADDLAILNANGKALDLYGYSLEETAVSHAASNLCRALRAPPSGPGRRASASDELSGARSPQGRSRA